MVRVTILFIEIVSFYIENELSYLFFNQGNNNS